MKASVRLGVLAVGLVMVVGLAFGAAGRFTSPVSAQAPAGLTVSSSCSSTSVSLPSGTTTCTTTISNTSTATVAFPQVNGVGIRTIAFGAVTGAGSNPVYGQVTILNGASSVAGPNEFTLVRVNNVQGAAQGIEIGCVGATCDFLAGDVVTIIEVFTAAVGGPINHSIQFATSTTAFGTGVSLQGFTVLAATVTDPPVCTPRTISAGSGAAGASQCVIDLDDNDIFPEFVSSANITVTLVGAPAGVVLTSTGTTTGAFNCGGIQNAPQSCDRITVGIQSNTAGVSGNVSLQINYQPDIPAVDFPIVLTENNVLTVAAAGPSTVAKNCTVTPDGIPASLAASTTTIYVRVGGFVNCTVTITGPAATPISGPVTVTLTNAVFNGANTFTCTSVAGTNTCTFVESFTPSVACVNMSESIVFTPAGGTAVTFPGVAVVGTIGTTTGIPIFVLPKANTGVECPGTVATLVQPDNLQFVCGTNPALFPVVGDPRISPIPGDAFGFFIAGVGVLPEALVCKVIPRVGTTAVAVAPAKIEVSSINGTLIDASGRLTTNLRIECGNISGVLVTPTLSPILPTIDKNNCVGVQFAVTGLGVGFVDLNARYEPAAFAVADGIIEIEAKGTVAFIAPFVSVNLGLSPNPVVVGATGTATSRFNRTTTCATGVICIDPTTGLPIAINLGSALNGTVIYTIDDSLIATWAAAQPTAATGTPSSTAGFQTSANQQAVRCGFLPTTTLPSPGLPTTTGGFPAGTLGLSGYFGGCETTTATYLAKNAGVTNITATFVPDLPGAYGSGSQFLGTAPNSFVLPTAPSQSIGALVGAFANGANPSSTRALEVVGAAPVGDVQLARGCNNVSPTVTESASAYAARVNPSSALVAIWEHQAATNTFRGWSPATGAPNDLAGVTRLRPVFVCVSGAAALSQPPA